MRLNHRHYGYICRACGIDSKEWKDARGLKKHYLDRDAHSVIELLEAGVEVWMLPNWTPEDSLTASDWLEDNGIILEKGAKSDGDDDYSGS